MQVWPWHAAHFHNILDKTLNITFFKGRKLFTTYHNITI